jgi:hypothetical protein
MALDLTALRAALSKNRPVVLTAPPGTGKTTTIPPALLAEPWLEGKKIIVLEPRRLAARRAAQYIAETLHESPGETVGWQVRLERCVGPKTRIEFLTEGLLARKILEDPELSDVGLIIFDEFHERALPLEVAFALTKEVREGLRPDLRVLIMSATLQSDILPDDAPSISRGGESMEGSPGIPFPTWRGCHSSDLVCGHGKRGKGVRIHEQNKRKCPCPGSADPANDSADPRGHTSCISCPEVRR